MFASGFLRDDLARITSSRVLYPLEALAPSGILAFWVEVFAVN